MANTNTTQVQEKDLEMARRTGKRYNSVTDLINGEKMSEETHQRVETLKERSKVTRALAEMRVRAGMTQKALAEKMGVTQSKLSKLESGSDDDVTVNDLAEYCKFTGSHVDLSLGKPLTHVEAVKYHAFKMKHRLEELAKLARTDEEIGEAVHKFFSEALLNVVHIISKCHEQLPRSEEFEVTIGTTGSADLARQSGQIKKTEKKTKPLKRSHSKKTASAPTS